MPVGHSLCWHILSARPTSIIGISPLCINADVGHLSSKSGIGGMGSNCYNCLGRLLRQVVFRGPANVLGDRPATACSLWVCSFSS